MQKPSIFIIMNGIHINSTVQSSKWNEFILFAVSMYDKHINMENVAFAFTVVYDAIVETYAFHSLLQFRVYALFPLNLLLL